METENPTPKTSKVGVIITAVVAIGLSIGIILLISNSKSAKDKKAAKKAEEDAIKAALIEAAKDKTTTISSTLADAIAAATAVVSAAATSVAPTFKVKNKVSAIANTNGLLVKWSKDNNQFEVTAAPTIRSLKKGDIAGIVVANILDNNTKKYSTIVEKEEPNATKYYSYPSSQLQRTYGLTGTLIKE